jgi:hypothetical protein
MRFMNERQIEGWRPAAGEAGLGDVFVGSVAHADRQGCICAMTNGHGMHSTRRCALLFSKDES